MTATRLGTSTTARASGVWLTGSQGPAITAASSITITDSVHEIDGSTTINTINGGQSNMGLILYKPTGATWALGAAGNIKAGTSQPPTERYVQLWTPDGNTWYAAENFIVVAAGSNKVSVAEAAGTYSVDVVEANLNMNNSGTTLGIAKGGTGQTTQTNAFDALAPTTTTGDMIYYNGTDNVRLAVGATGKVLGGGTNPQWIDPTFVDSTPLVKGSADATKMLRFEVDGFTAGTTRVLTPPNADATIAGLGVAQTFSAAQTFTGNVTVGSTGNLIKAIWYTTKTNDFGSISAGSNASTTATVTGAAAGDMVVVMGPDATATGDYNVYGLVSAPDTVKLVLNNQTNAAVSLGSRTYTIMVFDIT